MYLTIKGEYTADIALADRHIEIPGDTWAPIPLKSDGID